DGEEHAQLSAPDAAARGGRRAQPLQGQDEERGGGEVGDLDELLPSRRRRHGFFGPLGRNILSIRSVIRKPPTRLLVAATMAILRSPTRMIAPITAMASSAFVSDISGVCSSGETRRITSKPMNAASMKTYRLVRRSSFIPSLRSVGLRARGARRTPAPGG